MKDTPLTLFAELFLILPAVICQFLLAVGRRFLPQKLVSQHCQIGKACSLDA
jgi:hypothetical protein